MITGTTTYYAGGGGAGAVTGGAIGVAYGGTYQVANGTYGGGNGGNTTGTNQPYQNAVANTGGGGGGQEGYTGYSGFGGTGIVIIRYTVSLPYSALSYLPLSTNSTDIGILPQTVTTNGTVTYSTVGGKQAAYFSNSLSNYLSFTYTNKTTFTLCFWMYPIDGTYYTSLSITTSGYNPALQVDPSSSSVTVYTAMPNQWTNQPTGTTGGPGVWTHFAITINQTTYVEQLYINGSLVDTRTGSGTGISSRNLFIIGKSGDNGRAFYGYIRQFLFFDGVLSGANISSIYTSTA
jgi:hypothetical protein